MRESNRLPKTEFSGTATRTYLGKELRDTPARRSSKNARSAATLIPAGIRASTPISTTETGEDGSARKRARESSRVFDGEAIPVRIFEQDMRRSGSGQAVPLPRPIHE